MVRAGKSPPGFLFERFRMKRIVAISFAVPRDLSNIPDDLKEFEAVYAQHHPRARSRIPRTDKQWRSYLGEQARQLRDFVHHIDDDNHVITYDRNDREYIMGVPRRYRYDTRELSDTSYYHIRPVSWRGTIQRDTLSDQTKASLGRRPTVFRIPPIAEKELFRKL